MPIIEIPATAIVFDLDGVLANSIAMVEKTYVNWAKLHGLDADYVLEITHARRKPEIVAMVASLVNPPLDITTEVRCLIDIEQECIEEVKPIPGAAEFVASLPPGSWGIATSGEREIAAARLKHVGISAPRSFITAEDVTHGKPHPECYEKAAAGMGADPANCIVFEDAPLGIDASLAAGMRAVGVSTTYPEAALHRAMAQIQNFLGVRAALENGRLRAVIIPGGAASGII